MKNKLIEILVNWYDIDYDKINIKHSFAYETGPENKPDEYTYHVSLDLYRCPILQIKPNRKLKFDVIELSVTPSGRIKIVDTIVVGGFDIVNANDSNPIRNCKKSVEDSPIHNIIHEVLEILNKRMKFLNTPENMSILTKMVEVCNSVGEFGCASFKEYIMTRTKGSYGFSSDDHETKPTTPPNKEEPTKKERLSKIEYYLDIALAVAKRGTCMRRKFGAIIVNNDRIVSTGYVGAPRGRENCCDRGKCFREENSIPSGQRYELCRSVHAEMNAIINASKEEMEGSTLYLVGIENDSTFTKNAEPCSMCKRMIINAGITNVIVRTTDPNGICGYKKFNVSEWVSNDDSLNLHEGY